MIIPLIIISTTYVCGQILLGAEVRAAAPDRGIPGSSPARSFWDNLAKSVENDLSAGLEPGIPRQALVLLVF